MQLCGLAPYPFTVRVLRRYRHTTRLLAFQGDVSAVRYAFYSRRPGPLADLGTAAEAAETEKLVGPLASLPASDSLSRYNDDADLSDPMLPKSIKRSVPIYNLPLAPLQVVLTEISHSP